MWQIFGKDSLWILIADLTSQNTESSLRGSAMFLKAKMIVSYPTRLSLLFIFGDVDCSDHCWRLEWPFWPNFFCKMYYFYVSQMYPNFWKTSHPTKKVFLTPKKSENEGTKKVFPRIHHGMDILQKTGLIWYIWARDARPALPSMVMVRIVKDHCHSIVGEKQPSPFHCLEKLLIVSV